jgi:predicted nuclease with TOPRIM domain
MSKIKSSVSWILLIIILLVGFFVSQSIWASLKDTRAELARQKAIAEELARKDAAMRAYVDSLNQVLARLEQEEQRLVIERGRLRNELDELQNRYGRIRARLDTLWQAGSVIAELDEAFPHWRGQIREATRSDGVHALIAPRFFGADVAETKAKLDKSLQEIQIKDSTIANLDSTLSIKNEEVKVLTFKADSLQKTYDHLWTEYQALDENYQKLLKQKWFTLRFSPGNILSFVGGGAVGYVIGKN